MKKRIAILFILICSITISQKNTFSQAEFLLDVKDFIWRNPDANKVDLIIIVSLKNTGSVSGVDEDLNHLFLISSNPAYEFGKDITFTKFNSAINEVIEPGEEKAGYIIYRVPRDANDLKLKFPDFLGGGEKLVCFSYLNYNSKDAEGFLEEAHTYLGNGDYTNSLIKFLKSKSINPLLKINNEIDSVFNLFAQTDNSSAYYELFSEILSKYKITEKSTSPAQKKLVKLKGKMIFCREYRNGEEIGISDVYTVGQNGGYLQATITFNREPDIETITVKVVYNGLLFDITRSETRYKVPEGYTKIYIQNIHFSTPGSYTVKVYHPNGRKIASGKVTLLEQK